MPLKINITAQITNLQQLRNQIQRGLRDIQITAANVGGGINRTASRISSAQITEVDRLATRLNRLNASFDAGQFKEGEYIKKLLVTTNLMRQQGVSVDDLNRRYTSFQRAYNTLSHYSQQEIRQIIEGNKYRTEQQKSLDELSKKLVKLNQAYASDKNKNTYIQQTSEILAKVQAEGSSIDILKGKYTSFATAYKNLEQIRKTTFETKGKASPQEQEIDRLAKSLDKLNKAFGSNQYASVDKYVKSIYPLVNLMKNQGESIDALKTKYESYAKASQYLSQFKDQEIKQIMRGNVAMSAQEQELTKLAKRLENINKNFASNQFASPDKYVKLIHPIVNLMKMQGDSIDAVKKKYESFAKASAYLSQYKEEEIKQIMRGNALMTEQEQKLVTLAAKLKEENTLYKDSKDYKQEYIKNAQQLLNEMKIEGNSIDELKRKYESFRIAYKNFEKMRRDSEKVAQKNEEKNRITETEKELVKLNALFMQRSIKTEQYIKEVNKLTSAEAGLSAVTQKVIIQTEALNIAAKFKMGEITAKEYDIALKELIADKIKLKELDLKTMSFMSRTGKEAEQREKVNTAYKGNISAAERYLWATQKLIDDTQRYASLDAKTQDQIHANRRRAADDLYRQQMELHKNAKGADNYANSLGKYFSNMGMIVKKISDWLIGTTLVYGTINQIRKAVDYVFQMDDALAELSKVTNMSASNLEIMKNKAIEMGKALSVSSIEIMKSMAEFGRVNKDPGQIAQLSQYAAMASKITTMSAQDAAKAFNTTMILYKKNVSDVGHILDSLNNIQNNYRTSAEDLTDSISKVGAAAQQTGMEMENLQGYTTAIVSSTGLSGNEVGTALKSIISRIYRIGEEGLGSSGDAMKALEEVGIKVTEVNGTFRDIDTILAELNVKWKNMSIAEKQATAQAVAGTYHYSKFISLMNNFDIALSASQTALNSTGSAINEYAVYTDSATGRLEKLKTTIESKFNKAIATDKLKALISVVSDLIQAFGDLDTILLVLVTTFLAIKGTAITAFFIEFSAAVVIAGGGLKGFGTVLLYLTNPLFLVAAAITAVVVSMNVMKNAEEEAIQVRKDNIDALIRESNEVGNLKKIYDANYKLSNSDQEAKIKLLNVQERLVSIFGEEASKLDLVNGKYEEQINIINKMQKKKLVEDSKKIQAEMDYYRNKNYGVPILEPEFKFIGKSGYKIENEKNADLLDRRMKTNKQTILENMKLLGDLKLKILQSGDKPISKETLYSNKEYKSILSGINKLNLDDIKTQEQKDLALKAIGDTLEQRQKDLEYVSELERKAVENINASIESNLVLDEVQKQMFESAKAGFDTSNIEEYNKKMEELAILIESPAIRTMKQEYNNLNKEVSAGTLSIDEYNKKVEIIRKNAKKTKADENVINNLFRLTTDAQGTLSTLEELQKAETDAANAYNKTSQDVELLSTSYTKLLSGQRLDIDDKLKLLKIYPQLSSAMNDNALLLNEITNLREKQSNKIKGKYEELLKTDSQYYQDSLANSEDYFKELSDKYALDFSKYYNYQQLKENTDNTVKAVLGKKYTGKSIIDIESIKSEINRLSNLPGKGIYTDFSAQIQQLKTALGLLSGLTNMQGTIEDNMEKIQMSFQAQEFAKAADTYNQKFSDTISNVNELGEAMVTLQSGEEISSENLTKLIGKYPQLADVLGDNSALLRELTILHGTEANAAKDAYSLKLQYSDTFFQNVIKANQDYFNGLKDAYGVDLTNYYNYQHAKAAYNPVLEEYVGKNWSANIDESINKMKKAKEQYMKDPRSLGYIGVVNPENVARMEEAQKILEGYKKFEQEKDKILAGISFKGIGLDTKKEKEKSKSTEILAERYRELNAVLEKTNLLLSQNQELQSNATGQQLIKLIQEENRLLNIKKQNIHAIANEKRKEREEVKNELKRTNLGFTFTGTGDTLDVTNSKAILTKLATEVNKHRNDVDQTYYESVSEKYNKANELVDRFYNIGSDVRGYKTDYAGIESEIKGNIKQIADITIEEIEKKYTEIDKKIEKKNKEIQNTSNQMSLLDEKDYKGKLDLLNTQLLLSSDKVKILEKAISDLKKQHYDNIDVQKIVNEQIEKYADDLVTATYETKQFGNQIKETNKAKDESYKATVKENIGKYINYLKKQMEDYNKTLQDQIDIQEKAFANFKRIKEEEIKKIEEEADKVKTVRDEEEKLAAIRKQQQIIDNLRGQRTAKVYKEGQGWVMTVDIGKINEEQDKLKDLMDDYRKWQRDQAVEDKKKSLQNEIDKAEEDLRIFKEGKDGNGGLEAKIKAFEKAMNDLDKIVEDKDNYITSWNALIDSLKGIPDTYYKTELNNISGFFANLNTAIQDNKIDVSPIRNKLEAMIPPELKEFFKWTDDTKLPVGDKGVITKPIDTMKNEEKIAEMKKNSEAWFTASKEVQKQLENRNMELGTSMGWTRTKKGYWEDENRKVMYTTESQKPVNPAKMSEGRSAKKTYTYNGMTYTEEELLAQMKANSNAYSMGGNQEALAMKNAQIVQNYGLPYYKKDGIWYRNDNNARVYEQGGIADYTGMAWVDGSKSRPERILSAAQTASFNNLVKVLPDLNLGKISNKSETETENFYIDTINVTTNDATSFINNLKKITYKRGGSAT